MSTIMIVDDEPLIRDLLSNSLEKEGYGTACYEDGKEALHALSKVCPDLILLDLIMLDMDGLTFLKLLRKIPQYCYLPVILLTGLADRDKIIQAAKLGVNEYLLKNNFSYEEMLKRVNRYLNGENKTEAPIHTTAGVYTPDVQRPEQNSENHYLIPTLSKPASQAPPMFSNKLNRREALCNMKPIIKKQELVNLVTKGLELRPLAVVQSVMSATINPSCTAEDVAKAVGQDQALSIRILKLSNSSVYSRGRPVDNMKDAVGRLGIQEVRRLAMTLGVMEQYHGRVSKYVDAQDCWEHSLACGSIASLIGRLYGSKNQDKYFLWGMLHDLGRLIMLEHVPDLYTETIETANRLNLPLETVENKLLMLDHGDILAKALQHWNFPREFITPVVNHHKSVEQLKRLGPSFVESATIIALADRIAHAMLIGSSGNHVLYPFDEYVTMLGISATGIREIMDQVPNETNALRIAVLAKGEHAHWGEYSAKVREQLSGPVRALCTSPQPDIDSFKIFFEHLAEGTETEDPTLGIIYLPDARQQMQLFSKYQELEHNAKVAPLPLLIACAKGKLDLQQEWLANRRKIVVEVPVRIDLFIDTVNQILGYQRFLP